IAALGEQHAVVDVRTPGGATRGSDGQDQPGHRPHACAAGAHPRQALPSDAASSGASMSKVTGTRTRPATALPSLMAGWNFHCFTASSVAWSNTPAGSDFSTRAAATLPSAATSTITTTLPVTLLATASAGYLGGARF